MKTIRINRGKWMNGREGEFFETSLWNAELNAGCCLGHAIHQVKKCSWNQLNDCGTPESVYHSNSFLTQMDDGWLETAVDNKFAQEAMKINDDHKLSDKEREQKLIKLFKKNGFKLQFTGKYRDLTASLED